MMCYNNYNYQIVPDKAYFIIRNCGGCGCKSKYISTEEFRVNANGNRVDVWLIYQCEKCKHTYNLSIYERVRPNEIKAEYEYFLANDKEFALKYGMNKALFTRNKAEIDCESVTYRLEKIEAQDGSKEQGFVIQNPYELKLRTDKVISQILGISRSEVKEFISNGQISFENRYVGKKVYVRIQGEIDCENGKKTEKAHYALEGNKQNVG